jgi:CBS-domain-containing membrane protein
MNEKIKAALLACLVVQAAVTMAIMLHVPMILTSWASSAALIGAMRASPAARPLAVSGGHIVSGLVGLGLLLIARHDLPFDPRWMIAPGVGFAVLLMAWARVLHPPAAANPAIALVLPTEASNFAIALCAGAALLACMTLLLDALDQKGDADGG